MVDESLIAYLGDTPLIRSLFENNFSLDKNHADDYILIADKLKNIKIIDQLVDQELSLWDYLIAWLIFSFVYLRMKKYMT